MAVRARVAGTMQLPALLKWKGQPRSDQNRAQPDHCIDNAKVYTTRSGDLLENNSSTKDEDSR